MGCHANARSSYEPATKALIRAAAWRRSCVVTLDEDAYGLHNECACTKTLTRHRP